MALTRERIGREYLRVVGEAAHGRVGGVVVRCGVECGVGLVDTTPAGTWRPWGEVAAPIVGLDGRERRLILVVTLVGLARRNGRAATTFAEANVDGQVRPLPRFERLIELTFGTGHGDP
ncbi:hypothetical protein N9D23_11530 [Rubripirellula sp.]|nr:hypothetical protein [Rubripirellula sp.]